MIWSLPRSLLASKHRSTFLLGMFSVFTLFHAPFMILYFPCDETSIRTADSCCCTDLFCFISLKLRWCLLWSLHCFSHTYSHTLIRTPCLYHLGSSLRLQHFFFLIDPKLLSNYSFHCLWWQQNWARRKRQLLGPPDGRLSKNVVAGQGQSGTL